MGTLPTTNPTLLDLANRMDPNGKIPTIIELLNETNEILDDMTWIEGNLPTGHKTKVRTGIPKPTWRKLYQGVMPTRSTVADITATCGFMEAYSEIDAKEADLNGNTSEFRLSEDRPHLEGFNQDLADALFYANEAITPQKFTGFAPQFNDPNAESGENMINGGGTGSDNASIWLVVWSPNTVMGIVPKGMPAGFQMEDKGKDTVSVYDAAGNYTGKMEAYVTHYSWDAGLVVKDWRYVVRICNIDKSALTKDASAGADLIDLMTQALEIPPSLTLGRPVFYVPKTIRSMLRRQTVDKVKNSTLTMDSVAGKKVLAFDNVPVRRVDALSADEAAISFA
jgi:hypothetical protein